MKMRLITTTAVSLAMATTAFAQSPSKQPADTNPPAQNQQNNNNAARQNPPAQNPSVQQNQSQPQGSQAANPPPSGTNQSAGSQPSSSTTSQAPGGGTSPSQAQTAPSQQPSSQQSANPPANTNQAQQPNAGSTAQQQPAASGNTAQQQPGSTAAQQQQQRSTAQSSQTNVNAQVDINDQQRTRISQSIAKLDVKPVTNVNFSLSAGTVVPRDVHLATLPADVVEIVPQYRGFSFFVVKDEIVIVEPQSYKIVATLPYSGSTAAAAPQRERTKSSLSDRDREVIRKHSRSDVRQDRRTEGRTTGSATRSEIRIGDRLPESVEIDAFPDTAFRDAPALREYRYINRENRTYIIEPRERRVIEEIE
jgi:Protein of unknown function (DUF1236)